MKNRIIKRCAISFVSKLPELFFPVNLLQVHSKARASAVVDSQYLYYISEEWRDAKREAKGKCLKAMGSDQLGF